MQYCHFFTVTATLKYFKKSIELKHKVNNVILVNTLEKLKIITTVQCVLVTLLVW